MQKSTLFKQIPKVDYILSNPLLAAQPQGALLTSCVRTVLNGIRNQIGEGKTVSVPDINEITQNVLDEINKTLSPNLRKVINGTGIIIHTNLGRAPIAAEVAAAAYEISTGYSNLEYDTNEGKRGSRHSHMSKLLTRLTGAEAAIAVNNNAAAVLLALSAISFDGSEIIVSRGELVEIGGSFRVPDVCKLSGSILKEVGTTNKTHLSDYKNAINQNTAAILCVHPSNFYMAGFVSKPPTNELAMLAKENQIPLIEDLGSGCLFAEKCINEKTVSESLNSGADIVTFSGDKLLGGPQAGIIAGNANLIEKIKKHPLARAVRIDKLCLAALEATLRLYLDKKQAIKKIPVLNMLHANAGELEKKAYQLKNLIGENAAVTGEKSQAGGGSLPGVEFTSFAVEFFSKKHSPTEIEKHFRSAPTPIIGRIRDGRFILDVRTIETGDFSLVADRWNELGTI